MFIAGMQKLTLLDFPGVVACTLFTAGCNFRCPWCHNAGLVLPEEASDRLLESGEVLSFLEKRKGVLDGVCVTGGEPLLHAELPDFLKRVKDLGYRVKLDTNGSFPERLEALVRDNLADRVAMDIKNGPSRYAETVGLRNLDLSAVTSSKDFLLSDAVDYEFRTTVVRGLHTEESLLEAADWIQGAKQWFLQQFKDSGNLIHGEGLSAFSEDEMRRLLETVQQTNPAAQLRGV
ncbi:MAG: anaerobic ribonucleoside-triphosphate reductase activating protein [Oscillospiraceae bacterium]|nr:anaerobic ribonucleoside-triphosphate reductase activating protein [Oscillospiraceae bacterium]MBQ6609821.1 anaerobic ribonucleoside-triphosphate reductase activating protein [Oscillospiraceae bacterium]